MSSKIFIIYGFTTNIKILNDFQLEISNRININNNFVAKQLLKYEKYLAQIFFRI